MPEHDSGGPARTGGGAPLLATKLSVPRLRPDTVPRPRLERMLDAGRSGVLTLVTAPPGFGKTTLVSQWLRDDPTPTAWLALGPDDDDPARFLAYLCASLGTRLPGISCDAVERLSGPRAPPLTVVLTELLNDLAGVGPVIVVLDDYHTISHPDVHAGVSFLLDHAPEGLHAVLIARSDPPLPRSRLRASGLLTEVTRADLRATPAEAAAFLRDVMGLHLGDADVEALERRTEGWLAGLQLAGLSLRGHSEAARVIDAFRGDHRFVLDYLGEEVLRGLDGELRRFLLDTAILDRLSGPLCDAVTGTTGSQERLERLERDNVFTLALDDHRGWFRYHSLFVDSLRRRLSDLPPDRLRTLHARAGRWHADAGDVDQAIRHLVAADTLDEAIALLDRVATASLNHDGPARLLRWLDAFPREAIERDARIATAGAWARLAAGDVAGAEELTDAAANAPTTDTEGVTALRASLAFLRATLEGQRAPMDDIEALATVALARLGSERGWQRGTLLLRLAVCAIHAGHWDTAAEAGAASEEAFAAVGSRYGVLLARYTAADAKRWRGHLREAEIDYRSMLEVATRPDGRRLGSAAYALFGLARLALLRNELDRASALATEGLAIGGAMDSQARTEGMITLAHVRLAKGDLDGAEAAADEAAAAGARDVTTPMARPVAGIRAAVAAARGDHAALAAWLAVNPPPDPLEMGPGLHPEQVTRARALLALDRVEEAWAWLERLRPLAERHDRIVDLVEILVLQVAACLRAGQGTRAAGLLERSLALAAPEDVLRPFASESAAVARAWHALATPPTTAFDRRVAETVGATPSVPAPGSVAASVPTAGNTLPEPLSGRERTVLRLLVAGASNKKVARELGVSVNTVKTHVRNLYGKLGVRHRAELVAVVHDLRLLD